MTQTLPAVGSDATRALARAARGGARRHRDARSTPTGALFERLFAAIAQRRQRRRQPRARLARRDRARRRQAPARCSPGACRASIDELSVGGARPRAALHLGARRARGAHAGRRRRRVAPRAAPARAARARHRRARRPSRAATSRRARSSPTDDEIGAARGGVREDGLRPVARARSCALSNERLAAIGKMAAHVTHEIRNPLSAMGLNVELLEEELASDGRPGAPRSRACSPPSSARSSASST